MAKGKKTAARGSSSSDDAPPRAAVSGYPFLREAPGTGNSSGKEGGAHELQQQAQRKFARLLPKWDAGESEGEGEGEVPAAALVVSQVDGFLADCEWVRATEAFDEVEIGHGPSLDGGHVSGGSGAAQMRGFLAASEALAASVHATRGWERVREREEAPGTYAVKVFVDGAMRELVVDDKLPVLAGEVQCACIVRELPGEDKKEGTEGEEEPPLRRRVTLWPALLDKAAKWLQAGNPRAVRKCEPFALFNEWVFSALVSGETATEGLPDVPTDLEWRHLRRPRKERYFFKTWPQFNTAKAEATERGDEEALFRFEEAERAALERKAAHEKKEQEEQEEERQRQAAEVEAGAEAEAEATEGGARRPGKKRGKAKKRREEFAPFDSASFNVALQTFEATRASIHRALYRPREDVHLVRILDSAGVPVAARVAAEPAAPTTGEDNGEDNGDGDGDGEGGGEDEDGSATARRAEFALCERIATAKWVRARCRLVGGASYAVVERAGAMWRLSGHVAVDVESGEPGVPTGAIMPSFWVEAAALAGLAATEISTWVPARTALPSVTLPAEQHSPWRGFRVCAVDAVELAKDEGTGRGTGKGKGKGSKAGKAAETATTATAAEAGDEQQLAGPTSLRVSLLLSMDPGADVETVSCAFVRVGDEHMRLRGDMLASLAPVASDAQVLEVSIEQGAGLASVEVEEGAMYALRFDVACCNAATLQVLSSSPTHAPEVLPLLEAWGAACPIPAAERHAERLFGRFNATPAGDWQVLARYRVAAAQAASLALAGHVELTGDEDGVLTDHLRVVVLDQRRGTVAVANERSWVPPFQVESARVGSEVGDDAQEESAGALMDVLLIIDAAAATEGEQLPAGSFTFHLAANGPLDSVTQLMQPAPALAPGSAGGTEALQQLPSQQQQQQLFEGEYHSNRLKLLFRDYVAGVVPDALSLRLTCDAAFHVQLVLQDVAAQLRACAVGTADDAVLAQVASAPDGRQAGQHFADLHWLPEGGAGFDAGHAERRLVLQGVLREDGCEGPSRRPYWAADQVPADTLVSTEVEGEGEVEGEAKVEGEAEVEGKAKVEGQAKVEGGDKTAPGLRWSLRCATAGELTLTREVAWEAAVREKQGSWEAAHAGRTAMAESLRKSFLERAVGMEPDSEGAVDVATAAADAAAADAAAETGKGKGKESSEEADSAHRAAIRAALRPRLKEALDEKGQLVVRRCPVPATEDEEHLLDAFHGKQPATARLDVDARHAQAASWFAAVQAKHISRISGEPEAAEESKAP